SPNQLPEVGLLVALGLVRGQMCRVLLNPAGCSLRHGPLCFFSWQGVIGNAILEVRLELFCVRTNVCAGGLLVPSAVFVFVTEAKDAAFAAIKTISFHRFSLFFKTCL